MWWRQTPDPEQGSDDLRKGIAEEELSGLAYMLVGRLIILGLLALWALFTVPFDRAVTYVLAVLVFALLGVLPYALTRFGFKSTPVVAGFLALDAAILSYILIVPTPFDISDWSPQLNLRLPSFLFLGIFLVGMALSYKPSLVISTGFAVVASWCAVYLWVAGLPESVVFSSDDVQGLGKTLEEVLAIYLDPNAVALTRLSTQMVFLAMVTLVLALTVWRSRRLLHRQVAAESQRAALSRYFSPNIVRELANKNPFEDRPSVQPVAALFADMVGFTAISERLSPNELIDLLRDFHGLLARAAFAHGGTVDKYIGDAILVHFGTPQPKKDDPVRALTCASQMVADLERWNAERTEENKDPIQIGIGIHFGDVVVGNIGDTQRLEYAVLGDTVNVASRLEQLSRTIGGSVIMSDSLVAAIRGQGIEPTDLVPGLRREDTYEVRGRAKPVGVWSAVHVDPE